MIPINILFHALLSFFGRQESLIVCSKVTITLEPAHKTMLVVQEDLFGVAMHPDEEQHVLDDLSTLMAAVDDPFLRQQDGYRIEEVELFSPDGSRLDARIRIRWSDPSVLQLFGISPMADGRLAMVDIPSMGIRAPDATKEGNHLLFNGNAASVITIEPFRYTLRDINELRYDLLPAWQQWRDRR